MKHSHIIIAVLLSAAASCTIRLNAKKENAALAAMPACVKEQPQPEPQTFKIIKGTSSQKGFNRLDKNSRKTGIWISRNDGTYFEETYLDGKTNGICKWYHDKTGRIARIFGMRGGKEADFDYLFYDTGHLFISGDGFRRNSEPIQFDGHKYVPPFRCTCRSYYSSGALLQYGDVGYDESFLTGDDFPNQIYCNEDGSISETPIHQDYTNHDYVKDLNRADSTGLRQGLWIEDEGYVEAYYKDGALNGFYRSYSKSTGTLASFGEYKSGVKTGTWMFFNDSGTLVRKTTYREK